MKFLISFLFIQSLVAPMMVFAEDCSLNTLKKQSLVIEFQDQESFIEESKAAFEIDLTKEHPKAVYIYNCYRQKVLDSFGHFPAAQELYLQQRAKHLKHGNHDVVKRLDQFVSENSFFTADSVQAYLFAAFLQAQSFDLETQNEFTAIVLQKESKIKVFMGTYLKNPGVGPALDHYYSEIMSLIKNDHWEYQYHIHNHPFYFQEAEGGGLIPSPGDVKSIDKRTQLFGPQRSIVTNGIQYSIY